MNLLVALLASVLGSGMPPKAPATLAAWVQLPGTGLCYFIALVAKQNTIDVTFFRQPQTDCEAGGEVGDG